MFLKYIYPPYFFINTISTLNFQKETCDLNYNSYRLIYFL